MTIVNLCVYLKNLKTHCGFGEESDTDIHRIHMGYILFCKLYTISIHFLPPTILWPGVPDKLDDVLLLVVLSFPSPLPKTLRSSNNLYVGTKGFGPAAGAGFLGPALTRGSPCTADPFIPLKGKELYCCMGLAP
jgi:hypothetical protein